MYNSNLRQYVTISFVLLLGIILNIFLFQSLVMGLIFGLGYILFFSVQLGQLFFTDQEKSYRIILGALFLIVLLILIGTAGYYIYGLPDWVVCLVMILISWIVFIFKNFKSRVLIGNSIQNLSSSQRNFWHEFCRGSFFENFGKSKFLTISYLAFWLVLIFILYSHRTLDSILSPWQIVPKSFFVFYFVATATLTVILSLKENKVNKLINLFLISLHLFLSLAVVLIVYKIGYGFDGFVHRATEKVIFESGVINPKPFYYIGQYSLVTILSKLTFVKLVVIDKLLVPLLASIFLPILTYFSLKNIFGNKKYLLLIVNYLLIITTPLFFYSVPQALANFLLLILILLVIPYLVQKQVMPYFLWTIAMACFVVHPLAGIPAIIFMSLLYVLSRKKFRHPLLLTIYGAGSAICIPVFFWLGSLVSSELSIKFSTKNLIYFKSMFTNFLNYLPFHSIYHLIYFYKFNISLLFLTMLIIGTIYLTRKKHSGIVLIYLLITGLLFINLFLMSFLEFSSLINYEQGEFMRRLGQIISLFLSPIFLAGVYWVIKKILALKPYEIFNCKFSIVKKYPTLNIRVTGRVVMLLLTAGVLTISLYLNYPHVDAFEKTRGYSVSIADIKAVNWIEKNARGKEYVVLANQATSASALQEFGFRKYYATIDNQQSTIDQENTPTYIFYYPIPTTSPLYDLYLKMVYDQPSLEYIKKARELTGARIVYLVINDYWLDAQKRIEQAKKITDDWWNIDNGQAWVFRFE